MPRVKKLEIPENYFDYAISPIEALVENVRSGGSGGLITVKFEVHADYSKPEMVEETRTVHIEVRYCVRPGGRYIKVEWRPVLRIIGGTDLEREATFYGPHEPWKKISDHDSCWKYNHTDVPGWVNAQLKSYSTWSSLGFGIRCETLKVEEYQNG
jgi:hypothetical protein